MILFEKLNRKKHRLERHNMDKFSREFEISFRDVDITGHLTISTLVDFMQEIAREHAAELGLSYAALEDQYYWIVVRTKATLSVAPSIGEKIRLETYIAGLEKLFSVRRFDIYNEDNECLGYILAYYLLMNKENHRPVKLKNLTGKESYFQYQYEGEALPKLHEELEEIVGETQRKVYSSDIDTNHHMNNAHYIRWIMDMFSIAELEKKKVVSIQIQYVKEVLEGQEIVVVRSIEVDNAISVIGRNSEGMIHFISKVVVEMREESDEYSK